MATFNSVNIFGFAVRMNTDNLEVVVQQNTYPGLSGTESLTMGIKALYTVATGVLSGAGAAGLEAAFDVFRSYQDGGAYVLFTTRGKTWNNVRLESLNEVGEPFQDQAGNWGQRYQARFIHLTPS